MTFRNVGIGGDRSPGGNSRFKRDVLVHKPTAMTVDFGMNDGGYQPFDNTRFNPYMDGLQGMADQAKAANIRVAWITPQPLDNADPGSTALTAPPYNQTLEKFSDGVKSIAAKNGGLFVDQFHPYLAVLDKARGAGSPYNRITGGDAVHPGPPGQALMAASILKGLNFPRLVSSVDIDAAKSRDTKTVNCKVTEVAAESGGIRFMPEDAALPFFPDDAKPILPWSPILDDLNDYRLKVTGLAAGPYEIRLGGKKIAERTAAELASGVNLAAEALADGPVADQVKAVWNAVQAKNQYHHDRIFRGVVLSPANIPDWLDIKLSAADIEAKRKAAISDRMTKLPELDAAIRAALTIEPHKVEIVPASK